MTAIEKQLHRAFAATADDPASSPAPDLFERVRGSIDDDRNRRRGRLRPALFGLLTVLAAAATVATTTDLSTGGTPVTWWMLELATCLVLVGMALWLGPFIKRFGRAYAADVFRDNPMTGKSYIVLTDIVYYLIFGSYILFTIRFEPAGNWAESVSAAQLQHETARVAGILLIIGVLHGLNIVLMPVLGRLFSLNKQLRQ